MLICVFFAHAPPFICLKLQFNDSFLLFEMVYFLSLLLLFSLLLLLSFATFMSQNLVFMFILGQFM